MTVSARFIEHGKDKPLHDPGIMVKLYDQDANGRIEISFSHDAFVNDVVFKEAKPDFYFVILKEETPVYSTRIMQNITLEDVQQFRMGKGEVLDLGTFLVPEI